MSRASNLARGGLLNVCTPDLSELTEFSRDTTVTFCSAYSCQGSNPRPMMVADEIVNKCPKCGQMNHLFYDTATPNRIREFRDRNR